MIIAGRFSFNHGESYIQKNFPTLLAEIEACIACIDKEQHKTKISKEKTMSGRKLYSPVALNQAFKKALHPLGWKNHKEFCTYSRKYYTDGYNSESLTLTL